VILVASILVGTLGSRIGDHFFATELVALASPLAMAGLVLAVTTGLFVILPQKKIHVSDALAGALVTALLLFVLRLAFRGYLSLFTGYAAYGAVGALLALVMWIYLAAIFLLYGAEFSRAWHEARA
ncbi:MAG: YhjD/YihY/BrkB family envelope integrity protein, partial [Polyangiaceae bacterium]